LDKKRGRSSVGERGGDAARPKQLALSEADKHKSKYSDSRVDITAEGKTRHPWKHKRRTMGWARPTECECEKRSGPLGKKERAGSTGVPLGMHRNEQIDLLKGGVPSGWGEQEVGVNALRIGIPFKSVKWHPKGKRKSKLSDQPG